LKQQPGGDILISGSSTLVQSLMQTGLIDEYEFIVHPIIMGKGKRFFKEDMPIAKLELIETKAFSLV
jgi:dihydrofolate reductase